MGSANLTVPEKLDYFRVLDDLKRAGMSNRAVARRIGVSTTQLYRCKTGDGQLSYDEALRLISLHGAVLAIVPPAEQNVPSSEPTPT